jgi:hypothetical protein
VANSLGPPRTRISSDEEPPLSLMGMMYVSGRRFFSVSLLKTSTNELAAVPPEKTQRPVAVPCAAAILGF